jgi:hypothetical protein
VAVSGITQRNAPSGTLTAKNANPGLPVLMSIPFSTPNGGRDWRKTEMEKSKI